MTQPERKETLEKIEGLLKGGTRVKEACKQYGITASTFYWWRKQAYGKKKKSTALVPVAPVHHVFPISNPGGENVTVSLKGSPESLGRFLRSVIGGNR